MENHGWNGGGWTDGNVAQIPEGSNKLYMYAEDNAWAGITQSGNSSTITADFLLDTVAPTLDFVVPATEIWLNKQSSMSFVAFDATSGIKKVTVQWDGDIEYVIDGTSVAIPEGIHTVTIRATDNAGNVTTKSITFKVDTTPPSIPTISVDATSGSLTTLSASFIADDPTSGIAAYAYAIGSLPGEMDVLPRTTTDKLFSYVTGLSLVDGQCYYFMVWAQNGAGVWSPAQISSGITVNSNSSCQGIFTSGGVSSGTGTQVRTSAHYKLVDCLGQPVIGISSNDDIPMTVEHGYLHSDTAGRGPDVSIRLATAQNYLGGGIFNQNGVFQTLSATVTPNSKASYFARIRNSSVSTDTYSVKAPAGSTAWGVNYYDVATGNDITAQITSSNGWSLPVPLISNASREIRIEVTPTVANAPGVSKSLLIVATSKTSTALVDAVKAITTCGPGYQVDALVRLSSETAYLGDNLYNVDGSEQTKAITVEAGKSAYYYLRVQNDGNAAQALQLTGTPGMPGWTVKYLLNGITDITAQITGTSGYSLPELAARTQSSSYIYVQVLPDNTVINTTCELRVTVSSAMDESKKDTVKCVATATGMQPDLWIRNVDASYLGDNLFSADGVTQLREISVLRGSTANYYLRLQNDGSAEDVLKLKALVAATGWTVKYFTFANVDITAEVVGANGWLMDVLAPKANVGVYIKVTPSSSMRPGTMLILKPVLTSTVDSKKKDVGQLVTTATGMQPDLWVRSSADSVFYGDNVISTDGATQRRTFSVLRGLTANYYLRLQNDGSVADTLKLKAPVAPTGWTVKYFTNANVDITAEVTGATGWSTEVLAVGAYAGLYIKVIPISTISPGATLILKPTATSLTEVTRKDVLQLTTTATGMQPDLWVRCIADSVYFGDNIYSADGTTQRRDLSVMRGSTANYYLRMQNDGSAEDTLKLKAPLAPTGWTVKYFTLANVDVTAAVIGSNGWPTGVLPIGANVGLYVKVVPDISIPPGTTLMLKPVLTSSMDGTKKDVGQLLTTATGMQPDMWVRSSSDALYYGDNFFSSDGATQRRELSVPRASTAVYYLRLQNDGSSADTLKLKSTAAPAGWTVKYFTIANVDVTADVNGANGWSTGVLAVGANVGIYVKVTPSSSTPPGATLLLKPMLISAGDGTKKDVGQLLTTATGLQPDLWVRSSADAVYYGDNIFSNDGDTQRRELSVQRASTAIYYLRLQNDGSAADTLKLKSTAATPGWTVKYFTLANVDVTDAVTGSNGWSTEALPVGANIVMYIKVTPNSSTPPRATLMLKPVLTSTGDGTKKDVGQLLTTATGMQPDMWVRSKTDAVYYGDNIISADGATQRREVTLLPALTAIYYLRLQNDGSSADTLKLKSTAAAVGWTVKYFTSDNVDVTAAVTGVVGWSTALLPVGANVGIYIKVTPNGSIPPGAMLMLKPALTSTADATKKDVGQLLTTVEGVQYSYQPDLWARSSADAVYYGDNVISADGATQKRELTVLPASNAYFYLRLQNDGSAADTFMLKSTAATPGWTVKYFTLANIDVTEAVTGAAGWSTGLLSVGANAGIYARVTPTSALFPGSSIILIPTLTSTLDGTKKDVGQLLTTMVEN